MKRRLYVFLVVMVVLLVQGIPVLNQAHAEAIELHIAEKKVIPALRKLFMAEHPNVTFVDVRIDWTIENPVERIQGFDDLDIVEVTNDEGILKLIQNGFIAPLTLPDIVATHEMYFPQAREFLRNDGMVMGVPIRLDIRPWLINQTLWDELQLPPNPRTFDEYIDLINLWEKDYAARYPTYALAGHPGWHGTKTTVTLNLLYQFGYEQQQPNEVLSFDNEKLKSLVDRIFTVGELTYPEKFTGPLLQGLYDSDLWSIHIVDLQNPKRGEWVPMIPPIIVEGATPKIGGELTALCVLQQSKNKDVAMEYMRFVSDHKDLYQTGLSQMLLSAEESANHASEFPPDVIEAWNAFVPYVTFYTDSLGGFTYARELEFTTILASDLFFPWTDEAGVEMGPLDVDSFFETLDFYAGLYYQDRH